MFNLYYYIEKRQNVLQFETFGQALNYVRNEIWPTIRSGSFDLPNLSCEFDENGEVIWAEIEREKFRMDGTWANPKNVETIQIARHDRGQIHLEKVKNR